MVIGDCQQREDRQRVVERDLRKLTSRSLDDRQVAGAQRLLKPSARMATTRYWTHVRTRLAWPARISFGQVRRRLRFSGYARDTSAALAR